MKKTTVMVSMSILMAIAGGAAYSFAEKPEAQKWCREAKVALGLGWKAEDWKDLGKIRKHLSQEIEQSLKNYKLSTVKDYVEDTSHRHLLALWKWSEAEKNALASEEGRAAARQRNVDGQQGQVDSLLNLRSKMGTLTAKDEVRLKKARQRLAEVQAEAKHAHTLKQALASRKTSELFEMILNDPEWLDQLVNTGELVRPGEVLAVLASLYKEHPDMVKNTMVRDIATATALEFARSSWEHNKAVERANFFITRWKKGMLNAVFDTLPFWERRMVCGAKADHYMGSVESYRWFNDNVRLPQEMYDGACWQCQYLTYNIYGDIVFGPYYEEPFDDQYGPNRAQLTKEVGGVCGSLSHYGAYAAVANGVPASTMGEPGHCAYVVKIGDTWRPSYSLSWQKSLHWQPWAGIEEFTSLEIASALYADKAKQDRQVSQAYDILTTLPGDKARAQVLKNYEQAVKAQPRNISAWRSYINYLNGEVKGEMKEWQKLHNLLSDHLAEKQPAMAAVLLTRFVYPGIAQCTTGTAAERLAMVERFWKNVKGMGADRWDVEGLLNRQKEMVCGKENTDQIFPLYQKLLTLMVSNKEYAPIFLTWGNGVADQLKGEDRTRMMAAMLEGIGGGTAANERAALLAPIILSAEKSQDITTFRALARMVPDEFKNPAEKLPTHQPFEGRLMSQEGMLWASSTSGWDKVCAHWGVLDPEVGGQFHTEAERDAWVVVCLPRQTHVNGVVAVGHPSSDGLLQGMKLQVSETGNADDWKDVAQFNMEQTRVHRADTTAAKPRAKYIRILRPRENPEVFHLMGLFVYGEPAA